MRIKQRVADFLLASGESIIILFVVPTHSTRRSREAPMSDAKLARRIRAIRLEMRATKIAYAAMPAIRDLMLANLERSIIELEAVKS